MFRKRMLDANKWTNAIVELCVRAPLIHMFQVSVLAIELQVGLIADRARHVEPAEDRSDSLVAFAQ